MNVKNVEFLTPLMVLESIEQVEPWSKTLKSIISSEKGPEVSVFLQRAVTLFNDLETIALNPKLNWPQTPKDADRIKAIWVKSAHGTYLQETKDDRFKGKPWAVGNDRDRVNYALTIARSLAQLSSGQKLTGNWNEDQAILREYGLPIIYAGRWDETRDLRIASNDPLRYFPKDRLYPTENFLIIDGQIDNTADVIRHFRMPEKYHPRLGDEIAVVCHSPQTVRFLYMLQEIENHFPKQAAVKIFPIPVPNGGFPEYPLQELRGTVFYRFISSPQLASDQSYSWV